MSLTKWANKNVKKLDWIDIRLIKIAVAAFALLVAKLWPTILGLAWYWYALIFVLAYIRPICKMSKK